MLAYVPSLIQILFVEMLGAFFVAVGAASLAARRGVIGCPADPEIALGPLQLTVTVLGPAMVVWTLYRILFPAIVRHGVYGQVRLFLGNLHLTIPYREIGTLGFPSTHPAYAAVEVALFCFFVIPLFALGTRGEFLGCGLLYHFVLWWTCVSILFAFPALRLAAWYLLRRRYPNVGQTADADEIAKVVYVPLAIMVPVALFVFGSVLLPPLWAKRIDGASFEGGLTAHSALDGMTLHVRGVLREEPRTCACAPQRPRACYVADVLLDLGPGGEVIVRGLSDHAANVLKLADGGTGREVTVYGRLTRDPKPSGTSVRCAADPYDRAPGRPRAYLELL